MHERDLEKLLYFHPYLIGEEFAEITPRRQKRQLSKGKNRLDLLFEFPNGWCIVELKIKPLTLKDVAQLLRYCAAWNDAGKLGSVHYLIGQRPKNESKLLEKVKNCGFDIRFRYLGEHISTELVFEAENKRYRPLIFGEAVENYFKL